MTTLLYGIFGAYIITAVITGSSLFGTFRVWFIRRTPWLQLLPDHPHFVECRLCVGFWTALACTLCLGLPLRDLWLIYGASYFLATQER